MPLSILYVRTAYNPLLTLYLYYLKCYWLRAISTCLLVSPVILPLYERKIKLSVHSYIAYCHFLKGLLQFDTASRYLMSPQSICIIYQ
jgi:hypothetical protein